MANVASNPDFTAQLQRILRSDRFIRAHQTATLLRYLASHPAPEEWEIAAHVFGLTDDWDPANRIVAISLGRLRGMLAAYYENEGAADPVIVTVRVRTLIAEDREAAPAPTTQFTSQVHDAAQRFFILPGETVPRCVVTRETTGVKWYPIDGDHYNQALGNFVPLSGRLRTILDAVWSRRRATVIEQLDPRRLGNQLAPLYFQQVSPASAYGCAALAFSLSALSCARQPDHDRAIWLCDAIDYARRHYSAPLIRHVFRHMTLPFLTQLEHTDAGTAVRIALQLTAALEETGREKDAAVCLDFGEQVGRKAGKSFLGDGTRERYALLRRRAQLLAERNPDDKTFQPLMARAEEHTGSIDERSLSVQIDRIRRYLRQGSPEGLKSAHEASGAIVKAYEPLIVQNGAMSASLGVAAHLGEILLLSGIAACRLRPSGWKSYAEESVALGQSLVHRAGHVLPTEYLALASTTLRRYNANSSSALRLSSLKSRPEPPEALAEDAALVLKALARLRLRPGEIRKAR